MLQEGDGCTQEQCIFFRPSKIPKGLHLRYMLFTAHDSEKGYVKLEQIR